MEPIFVTETPMAARLQTHHGRMDMDKVDIPADEVVPLDEAASVVVGLRILLVNHSPPRAIVLTHAHFDAPGHGRPISGETSTRTLTTLADRFDEVARPAQGRYVRNPERG
jgi:hypothetical protein